MTHIKLLFMKICVRLTQYYKKYNRRFKFIKACKTIFTKYIIFKKIKRIQDKQNEPVI